MPTMPELSLADLRLILDTTVLSNFALVAGRAVATTLHRTGRHHSGGR
jgi:hypothetical protein